MIRQVFQVHNPDVLHVANGYLHAQNTVYTEADIMLFSSTKTQIASKQIEYTLTEGVRNDQMPCMHTLPTAPRTTVVSEHPYTVAYFTGANI